MEKDIQEKELDLLRKELNEIYTPLSEAKEEIWRRWNDKELRKKVSDFFNGDVPKVFEKEPRAILARHVATPNTEHINFLKKVSMIDIPPLFLEYLGDNYSTTNSAKYYLGKIFFMNGKGKNGGNKVKCKKIINFDESSNKKIKDIKLCDTSKNLIHFHHNFLDLKLPEIERFDISSWYKKRGGTSKKYFKYFLTLFIRNGILFENFLTNEEEKKFTREVVIPNFLEIEKIFGIKPLIVRLFSSSMEDDDCCYWYPGFIEKDFDHLLDKYQNIKN